MVCSLCLEPVAHATSTKKYAEHVLSPEHERVVRDTIGVLSGDALQLLSDISTSMWRSHHKYLRAPHTPLNTQPGHWCAMLSGLAKPFIQQVAHRMQCISQLTSATDPSQITRKSSNHSKIDICKL